MFSFKWSVVFIFVGNTSKADEGFHFQGAVQVHWPFHTMKSSSYTCEMVNAFADDIQKEEDVTKISTVIVPGIDLSDQRAWWLPTPDGSDKVWSLHFRKVLSCNCGMPETFEEAQFI
jgi:hypothetical protein